MPTCMAKRLCTPSLRTIRGAPILLHALLDRCNVGKSSGAEIRVGHPSGRSFHFTGNKKGFYTAPTFKEDRLVVVRAEVPTSSGSGTSTSTRVVEKTDADTLVDGMTFAELCDDFECISSPAVEATARLLARDLLELRESNRTLSVYAMSVSYKDPLRSFTGREKFKRTSWIKTALSNPTVAVRQMQMLSTSILNVKWTLRGTAKLPPASVLGGELVLSVNSTLTLNQISGQVTQQTDEWDLSGSSPLAVAYFWATRLSYSAIEAGKDAGESLANIPKSLDKGNDDDRSNYYPDPSGDPRKFFQIEDNPQRDIYQVGFVIALIYLLVQFLKLTL